MEFTDALSVEQYRNVSYLKMVLHVFNTAVLKSQDDVTQLTMTIKEGILNYLNEKYDDQTTQELLDMASLGDRLSGIQYKWGHCDMSEVIT